jgi:hypothetical protein
MCRRSVVVFAEDITCLEIICADFSAPGRKPVGGKGLL